MSASEDTILKDSSEKKVTISESEAAESDDYRTPESVEELTDTNIKTILQLEAAAIKNQSTTEWIAKKIADFCGSMIFVWVHVAWFGFWIIFNTIPGIKHFDDFPFTFLTLVVSLEAIFLSTFILISQNQETRITERNTHLDLQINLLTEQENTKMLQILSLIAKKLDIECDPTVQVLEQATRPEKLVEQIENETAKA